MMGNINITREDMPSFNWREADPNYLYQSFQDTIKKAKSVQMPVATPMMATQETGNNAWENK